MYSLHVGTETGWREERLDETVRGRLRLQTVSIRHITRQVSVVISFEYRFVL